MDLHRRFGPLALAGLFILGACDGPSEKAGQQHDASDAVATAEHDSSSALNERIGEVQGHAATAGAATAGREPQHASADSLQARGKEIQRKANVEAASFDEKSRAIRQAADMQSAALADQVRQRRN